MANGRARTVSSERGVQRRHQIGSLTYALILLVAITFSGCGLKLFGSSKASVAAHTVLFTSEGCSTFVARTLHEGLTLVENSDRDFVPSPGDVFEGPARLGPSVFRLFDGTEARLREGGRSVSLTFIAMNLKSENARTQLNDACAG